MTIDAAPGQADTLQQAPAGSATNEPAIDLDALLIALLDRGGSDLHLTAGSPPVARIDGKLHILNEAAPLTSAAVQSAVYQILTSAQRQRLEEDKELDGSHSVVGRGRFRFNVFRQRGSLGVVFRAIPSRIPSLDELGMPDVVAQLAALPRGLVLVTGPTGAGKSTTLAALIDLVNSTRAVHVMTIEDPIEVTHSHKMAIVNQREVGEDTHGFGVALRHVFRQDPDVVLIGEMRDVETIGTALTAAETGHLVFGTLHTNDASQTVERIIDVFPAHQQQQIRVQVAASLQAVVSQQLIPKASGSGRAAAVEMMIATPAVRNYIRENKTHQLPSTIQAGGQHGMQSMDQALARLVLAGKVEYAAAADRCRDRLQFDTLAGRR